MLSASRRFFRGIRSTTLQTMDIDAKDITTGCKQLVLSVMTVHLPSVHDFSDKHFRQLNFFVSLINMEKTLTKKISKNCGH